MHRRIVAERGFLIVARHGRCLLFWWVDPSGGGQCGRLWGDALEADGMGSERGIEGDGALLGERRSGAVVDGGRSHQADTAVAMFVIVPVEEVPAVSTGVLDRAETIGEVRSVLQGFELRLGVWIISIQGDADPTVPYSQNVRLHQALDKAGIRNELVTIRAANTADFPTRR